jgi:hypothetical protein
MQHAQSPAAEIIIWILIYMLTEKLLMSINYLTCGGLCRPRRKAWLCNVVGGRSNADMRQPEMFIESALRYMCEALCNNKFTVMYT